MEMARMAATGISEAMIGRWTPKPSSRNFAPTKTGMAAGP